ncbi:MAG: hypothetical protein SF052_15760 [Bacteroidia bacterium]|nr:hypothetical protein [Bacteroidia bacterium]
MNTKATLIQSATKISKATRRNSSTIAHTWVGITGNEVEIFYRDPGRYGSRHNYDYEIDFGKEILSKADVLAEINRYNEIIGF